MSDDKVLWHQSGVSPTGEPFVQLIQNDEVIAQMTPELARDHARAITEAAEAAEQDAFIMQFMQEKEGLNFENAARVLIDLRNYRAERTGKAQGPTRARDWVMPPDDKRADYGNFGRKDGK